jgi:hypothetical protein
MPVEQIFSIANDGKVLSPWSICMDPRVAVGMVVRPFDLE